VLFLIVFELFVLGESFGVGKKTRGVDLFRRFSGGTILGRV